VVHGQRLAARNEKSNRVGRESRAAFLLELQMKRRLREFIVRIGNKSATFAARSAGNAARKAFRAAIKNEEIKRQPPTTEDGGWKDVSITLKQG
jgi:hypothetical protein